MSWSGEEAADIPTSKSDDQDRLLLVKRESFTGWNEKTEKKAPKVDPASHGKKKNRGKWIPIVIPSTDDDN